MGFIRKTMSFPLVPKLRLGTHLFRQLHYLWVPSLQIRTFKFQRPSKVSQLWRHWHLSFDRKKRWIDHFILLDSKCSLGTKRTNLPPPTMPLPTKLAHNGKPFAINMPFLTAIRTEPSQYLTHDFGGIRVAGFHQFLQITLPRNAHFGFRVLHGEGCNFRS